MDSLSLTASTLAELRRIAAQALIGSSPRLSEHQIRAEPIKLFCELVDSAREGIAASDKPPALLRPEPRHAATEVDRPDRKRGHETVAGFRYQRRKKQRSLP